MMELLFPNGFKAELGHNTISKGDTLRLYSPDDVFLASVPCEEKDFCAKADALLNGYFAGWRDCKFKMSEAIKAACRIEITTG